MDAAGWDERYAASELVWSRGPNQFVEQECADLTPGRAVDLAAGEGRNAIWLASRGWSVTAVDFSVVALDKGRTLAGDLPVTWRHDDATTWQGDGLDLALIAYLQLAAPERRAATRAAFDALAPGGTFLLVAHDSTNLTDGTGGPQEPARLMTATDVLDDLAGRHFEVVRAGRVPREVVTDDGPVTAWDCLVRLTRVR